MCQFFERLSSGYIESIDFENGSMQAEKGPLLRISDPNAVVSVGYAGFSAFPMCIPRNATDPLFPASSQPFRGSGTLGILRGLYRIREWSAAY